MKPQADRSGFRFLSTATLLVSFALFSGAALSYAGIAGVRQNAVGGVMIDAQGLVRAATVVDREDLLNQLRAEVKAPPGQLGEAAKLRMVSLAKLQQAIRETKANGQRLPDEMRYLAGLQRVEYVLVYPEQQDIVLAGPAEPWVVREDASVVGAHSGQPTLLLEDLMIAMQSVEMARQAGISCSIEPTAEGRQRLNALLRRAQRNRLTDPRVLEPAMREAFGPQTVKLTGVPTDSRYARVLVAADFEMKRIAMELAEAPIQGLPSYMTMAKNQRQSSSTNPRWWMTTNYNALERTADRLAWRISGQGVKTLTESDRLLADGNVEQAGRTNKTAQKWAELMTEKYPELARSQAIFGDLRNIMDLSVIATLITQERLEQHSGCDLDVLMGTESLVQTSSFQTPRAIEPQCSFIRGNQGWIVSTSGGVSVNAFEVVSTQKVVNELSETHQAATADADTTTWWWNS
ncbi:DUF1598 domain-containing protein [Roseimaritima ulvae]|uniref:DUF1598 domain-containing protein n=1 Tax=Roseimaritima ulvae TaxID=980254 RepID=A0A5B9R840_9BACT|nr:DUF1598 domain-containing protein [Roseimaritima ulvae]QEG42713.1 hypothetical protein UC8_47550 [Roseimaritima ulvae]